MAVAVAEMVGTNHWDAPRGRVPWETSDVPLDEAASGSVACSDTSSNTARLGSEGTDSGNASQASHPPPTQASGELGALPAVLPIKSPRGYPPPLPKAQDGERRSLTPSVPLQSAVPTLAAANTAAPMLNDELWNTTSSDIPEAPPGTGPLYKCAICGEFVYESQLDHHVLICPDPPDMTVPTTKQPEVTVDTSPLSVPTISETSSSSTHSRAPSPGSSTPTLGGSLAASVKSGGMTPPAGRQPVKTAKEVSTQPYHVQSQRSSGRRNAEEARRKKEDECTFQPRVLSRGSPRTCGRSHEASGEHRLSQRGEQHQRSQRLKQAEAQAYAEVTLKPRISRFAQAWSQRQSDAQTGGQPSLNVFERLYATMQAREPVDNLEEQEASPGGDTQDSSATLSATSSQRTSISKQSSRKNSTSELLYSDALDRRKRLRAMAEQLQSRAEEVAREKRQVSGRSRRYYWQMLERQIKASFDATTGGAWYLKQSELEDFLVHFKCLRVRSDREDVGRSHPGAVHEDESSRLCSALWRHLDPQLTGHTDLLTLTVFFHVLMGAVDDAARDSQSMYSGAPVGGSVVEECPAAPSKLTVSPASQALHCHRSGERVGLSDGDFGDVPAQLLPRDGVDALRVAAVASLVAITEEDGDVSGDDTADGGQSDGGARSSNNDGLLPSDCFEVPAPAALTQDDDEARRIVDLLLRFDPIQLRTEFQTIYMQRMYYQSKQDQHVAAPSTDVQVVPPEIDSKSRILAAQLVERMKCESEKPLSTHADLLLWRHSQTEAKKEEKRAQAKHEEVNGCTFRPKTSPRPHDFQVETVVAGATRTQVLYARGLADKERREARAQEVAQVRSNAEVRDCTFRPDTAKSERSRQRANDSAPQVPRGYYETRDRLRAANEIMIQKRKQREDRMAKLAPAVGSATAPSAPASSTSSIPSTLSGRVSECGPFPCTMSPLPPVAEEQQNRRRAHSPRASSISREGRSSSAGPGLRVTKPVLRNNSAHRHTDPPFSARGGSQAHSRTSSPVDHKPTTPRSSRVSSVGSAQSFGSARIGSLDAGSGGSRRDSLQEVKATSASARHVSPAQGASEDNLAPPLLYVDVNLSPGQQPERIVLREGQSVNEVVAEFAARHVLTPVLAQRLHALLQGVLQRQEGNLLEPPYNN